MVARLHYHDCLDSAERNLRKPAIVIVTDRIPCAYFRIFGLHESGDKKKVTKNKQDSTKTYQWLETQKDKSMSTIRHHKEQLVSKPANRIQRALAKANAYKWINTKYSPEKKEAIVFSRNTEYLSRKWNTLGVEILAWRKFGGNKIWRNWREFNLADAKKC